MIMVYITDYYTIMIMVYITDYYTIMIMVYITDYYTIMIMVYITDYYTIMIMVYITDYYTIMIMVYITDYYTIMIMVYYYWLLHYHDNGKYPLTLESHSLQALMLMNTSPCSPLNTASCSHLAIRVTPSTLSPSLISASLNFHLRYLKYYPSYWLIP